MAAFADELRKSVKAPVLMTELDCHINDAEFADAALEIFDGWVADGTIGWTPLDTALRAYSG